MNQTKSTIGTKTMIVSPHYLSSMAGARILEKGGNAFDAAVAVSACLAVVYPHMTGVGGDSFWLTWHEGEKSLRAYNGSGRSGYKIHRGLYEEEAEIPTRGIRSAITVPGMVDSWNAILKEYGRLTLQDVLEPAIEYARRGFPLSPDQYTTTNQVADVLRATETTAHIYLTDGSTPSLHKKFIQTDLAATLTTIAIKGRDAFYKGEIAKEIVSYIQQQNGYLTLDDFADHHGNWTEPISTTYHDYTVYQVPPNSQGFSALEALNILENFDFEQIEQDSYEYYHILIEALKKAFKDRNTYLTDPDFYQAPFERLLSKTYAKKLAADIHMKKAHNFSTVPLGQDTAYAAVVDEEGNAVSFIQSLYFEYGSGVVAGSTGVLLQNRGSFFSLDPNHVNTLEPHKRTFHTLMPAMAFLNEKPRIIYGTQGGEGQPQTQTLMFTRMAHYGMNPQQAVSAPRFVWGRTWGQKSEALKIENRIPQQVYKTLINAGHNVQIVQPFDGVMGHAHAILINDDGFRCGGTDPRCDGAAIGW